MPHKKIHIKHGQMQDDFDEEIAPLILNLWKLNITVMDGCQEVDPGWSFLEFVSSLDLENFLDLVSEPSSDSDSIHSKIENSEHSQNWEPDIQITDFGHENPKFSNYHVHVYLRFPKSDIPGISKKISERLEFIQSKTKENDPALN
jgi:hypothetical protein